MKYIILIVCILTIGCGCKNKEITENNNDNIVVEKETQISIDITNSNIKNSEIKVEDVSHIRGILKNESNEEITISSIVTTIYTDSIEVADNIFYNVVPEKLSSLGEYLLDIDVGDMDLSNATIKISVITE